MSSRWTLDNGSARSQTKLFLGGLPRPISLHLTSAQTSANRTRGLRQRHTYRLQGTKSKCCARPMGTNLEL